MKKNLCRILILIMLWGVAPDFAFAEDSMVIATDSLRMEIGEYGQIKSLKIIDDIAKEFCDTEYVLNKKNAGPQGESDEHEWMGELIFTAKTDGEWKEFKTSQCEERRIERKNGRIKVTYGGDYKVAETFYAKGKGIVWEIEVENNNENDIVIGDWGLPMPFNQYWTPGYEGEELYDTRCVYHSFVGGNSSYIYAQRPSGQGKMLLFTPVAETGAGFEYRDHWRVDNGHKNSAWAQDQKGYHSGLDVFYIHSDVIKKTGSGYMKSTSLTLRSGEKKKYAFEFTAADNGGDMKSILYEKGIVDAEAVPGAAFAKDMPASFYLHANEDVKIENVYSKCVHETKMYENRENFVCTYHKCGGDGEISFREKVVYKGENYYVYDMKLPCLGANNVYVEYELNKTKMKTMLQFYVMEPLGDAIDRRSEFLTRHQTDTPGKVGDKTFDDWMMDEGKNRADTMNGYWDMSYWGYGDDWGLTHGTFLAMKNVYKPSLDEVTAVDEYLDIAVWNTLMREHREDFLVHDFLSEEPNMSPTYRGYAYPHIYNTYFAMYQTAVRYPDLIDYKEERITYLERAYNILKALYSDKVAYNWATGLMGEITTPEVIEALYFEGMEEEAREVERIMGIKYSNFKNTKYPYGSEYSYDNTGEEAVYTLAKMNGNKEMMYKIDLKTRACRGMQPVWYHYANPVTICGENRWNFQYTAALAGYCMDDYLRFYGSGMTKDEKSIAQRMNYGGKLANFTCINSGQIDSDEKNIGTVSWAYQAELGHNGGQGMERGKLHNGWRQMSGEADLGLFGALRIISADVAEDPVFGLTGYGCEVTKDKGYYTVVPKDGLFTRLNFINEGIYIELEGAYYTKAAADEGGKYIELDVTDDESFTRVKIYGLKKGKKYGLYENGKLCATSFGEDGCFTYKGGRGGKVVIKENRHLIMQEGYRLPKGEKTKESRGKAECVKYDFGTELEYGKYVGNVKEENGYIISDGSVRSYVRLDNAFTNGTENFSLRMDICLDGVQKEGCSLIEFSDMENRNLSAVFGQCNEIGININGEYITDGVRLPENFEGNMVLVQKGDWLKLFVSEECAVKTKTKFRLKELGDVQRNYIFRGRDESKGAVRGKYRDFAFENTAWDMAEREKERTAVGYEEIVYDKITPLPDKIAVRYSDGFTKTENVKWGEEKDGFIAGKCGEFEVAARVRAVDTEKNKAFSAKVKVSYCSLWESEKALNDGVYTVETSDPDKEAVPRFGTWTREAREEWMEYCWSDEIEINGIGIVFLDDGGGVRAPLGYRIEYLNEKGGWEEVKKPWGLKAELKKINITTFETVLTKALRVTMDKGDAAGVGCLEWEVY